MSNKNKMDNQQPSELKTKDIPGFEGHYTITENGDVYSIKTNKYLKNRMSQDGYKRVALFIDGKRYEHRVARLVAMTFIDNPNNLPQVNHKDLNTINDYVENLEWCTNEENSFHAALNGRREGTLRGIYKSYTFTNVFNNKSFTILGFKNLLKYFNVSDSCKRTLMRRINTGEYIKKGIFKGLKIDVCDLKVQRLSREGVDLSKSKCRTPEKGEDIV